MEVRPILTSSGTLFFWHPVCELHRLFCFFEWFSNFHQIDSKNHPIGDSAHARRQKGGVPEAAEIGRTLIPFQNESTEGKLKNKSKNIPTGNSAHARCQKGGVPEEAEIYLQLIHFKKVWYYGQFQRGRREKISKKEKEKGKRTRKKEDGKEESKKSKANLIHSGPNSRSPAPRGNYW